MNTLLCYYTGAMQVCYDKIEFYLVSKFDIISGLKNGKVREVYCQMVANMVRLGIQQGNIGQKLSNVWANQFRCLMQIAHNSLEKLYHGTSHVECQINLV